MDMDNRAPSVLCHCWFNLAGWQEGHPVCNKISRISDPRRLFTGRRVEDPP